MLPVLLVHGIWNSGRQFRRMQVALRSAGAATVQAVDLEPNSGDVTIAELALQVARAAKQLSALCGGGPIDVVGFSMGALVTRYWIQRLGGDAVVRRFISIAGPQQGTLLAYLSGLAGVRDMRPRSSTLRELDDGQPWQAVELHCLWTPFDLMIVPPRSSVMRGARSVTRLPVLLHRWMLDDERVIAAVIGILSARGGPVCEDEPCSAGGED